jgi:uncharacterized hydrophobic protein (TIGR00341 family)
MKIIEAVLDPAHLDTVTGIAAKHQVADYRLGAEDADGRRVVRMLVADEQSQAVLDALQGVLGGAPATRIIVIPVEAALPRPPRTEKTEDEKTGALATTREELYDAVEKSARLDSTYLVLVLLSTIAAAIGLIEDNVAVVIGAMVIAPLLGPNIALALGTALGDKSLMWQAARSGAAGLGLALGLSVLIGLLWPGSVTSHELLARSDVGLDSVALALASGAAAVLSLTTGLPSVLVGVMVAVALLPPTATLGLMLGTGQFGHALGAGLLLAVNIVCVNLAAKVVFFVKGVRPRTWWEQRKARQSFITYLVVWGVSLILLLGMIYLRRYMMGAP